MGVPRGARECLCLKAGDEIEKAASLGHLVERLARHLMAVRLVAATEMEGILAQSQYVAGICSVGLMWVWGRPL